MAANGIPNPKIVIKLMIKPQKINAGKAIPIAYFI